MKVKSLCNLYLKKFSGIFTCNLTLDRKTNSAAEVNVKLKSLCNLYLKKIDLAFGDHSKGLFRILIINYYWCLFLAVTSMLVTNVGEQMCWWQVWDVGDRFDTLRNSPTSLLIEFLGLFARRDAISDIQFEFTPNFDIELSNSENESE